MSRRPNLLRPYYAGAAQRYGHLTTIQNKASNESAIPYRTSVAGDAGSATWSCPSSNRPVHQLSPQAARHEYV